jgi:hypothetical protein
MTPDKIRKIVLFASDDFADVTVTRTITLRVSRQEAERLASLGVAGEVLHKCQKVDCKQTFTRQEGRSFTGRQRATGVRYCSAACAQAQGQREYRKRLRAVGA